VVVEAPHVANRMRFIDDDRRMSRRDVVVFGFEEDGMANVVVVVDDEVRAPRRRTTPTPYRRLEKGRAVAEWSFRSPAWINNNINSTADIVVSRCVMNNVRTGLGRERW
jgi:hypothetical protein